MVITELHKRMSGPKRCKKGAVFLRLFLGLFFAQNAGVNGFGGHFCRLIFGSVAMYLYYAIIMEASKTPIAEEQQLPNMNKQHSEIFQTVSVSTKQIILDNVTPYVLIDDRSANFRKPLRGTLAMKMHVTSHKEPLKGFRKPLGRHSLNNIYFLENWNLCCVVSPLKCLMDGKILVKNRHCDSLWGCTNANKTSRLRQFWCIFDFDVRHLCKNQEHKCDVVATISYCSLVCCNQSHHCKKAMGTKTGHFKTKYASTIHWHPHHFHDCASFLTGIVPHKKNNQYVSQTCDTSQVNTI